MLQYGACIYNCLLWYFYFQSNAPCVLFIDEIDAITPKREVASKDMERRIVAQLLTCMDGQFKIIHFKVMVRGYTFKFCRKVLQHVLPHPLRATLYPSPPPPRLSLGVFIFDGLLVKMELLPYCPWQLPVFIAGWLSFPVSWLFVSPPHPFSSRADCVTEFLKIDLKGYFILICYEANSLVNMLQLLLPSL